MPWELLKTRGNIGTIAFLRLRFPQDIGMACSGLRISTMEVMTRPLYSHYNKSQHAFRWSNACWASCTFNCDPR